MRFVERQKRLEGKIFDAIEELAEEFNLDVPFYPEVYYLGKKMKFEDMGLNPSYREDFESLKRGSWAGMLFEVPRCIILPSENKRYMEEVAHFVHYINCGGMPNVKTLKEQEFAQSIKEMLGFFGSIILGDNRSNPYSSWPDIYNQPEKFKTFVKKINSELKVTPIEWRDHLIHQQGYSLGERLFYYYESGKITKKEIRAIFKNPLSNYRGAGILFLDMRKRLGWPVTV